MKKDIVIGVLGGMGTYATINLFQKYAEIFPAEKEWDRPRIIIDNRCTMPSRARAFLYNENVEQLVDEMSESIKYLMEAGSTHIILACNTSHLFLPKVYENLPEAKNRIVDIIQNCVEVVKESEQKELFLLASEGTIDSGIYQQAFEKVGIKCIAPEENEYYLLRNCIEAVKQGVYTKEIKETFLKLLDRSPNCILGCTELPILFDKYREDISMDGRSILDPLTLALGRIKSEYEVMRCK